MPERELAQLMGDLSELIDRQGNQIGELHETVEAQNAQLAHFVPKRRFRWVVGVVGMVIAAAFVLGMAFRVRDDDEAERRRAGIVAAQEQDRQSSIRGCERSNDLRATLREVINLALTQTNIPPGLSPEFAAVFRDAQVRTLAKRDELLALAGVQPIDCQAQFPPLQERA